MLNLHMLIQIPSGCLCIQLSVYATAPRILTNFSPSHVKILFYRDRIESTEWYHNSVLVIVSRLTSLVEDFEICRYQVTKKILHEVVLRQCVFYKEPLSFCFARRLRNFGLLGSEYKYCASLISLPLSLDVLDLIPENCVWMQAILSTRFSLKSSNHSGRSANGRPIFSCHPAFYFVW